MGAGSANSRWELAMEPTTLRPRSGLAMGARNGGVMRPVMKGRRGHIRSVKKARETLGLLAVGLAVGAGSGGSRWELAMEPTTLRPHSGLARGARNGGACDGSWIVPDLPQIWYEKHVLIRRSHLVMNRTGYAHEQSSERKYGRSKRLLKP